MTEHGDLPKGLLLGTAVFAVVAAAVLALSMRLGREKVEARGTQIVEQAPVESPRPITDSEPAEPPPAEEAAAGDEDSEPAQEAETARQWWESGAAKSKAGDLAGAKADWRRCLELDPDHRECGAALKRAGPKRKRSRR